MYGASQLVQGSRSSMRGQFVDLDHPITCSGMLASLQFCFYTGGLDEDQSSFKVYFRIFRYDPEEGILRQTHFLDRNFHVGEARQSFMCLNHYYDVTENVFVLSGDYVAVYIASLSPPLPVLGTNIPRMKVYRDMRIITTQFFSTTVSLSMLEPQEDTVFHVSAEISKCVTSVVSAHTYMSSCIS